MRPEPNAQLPLLLLAILAAVVLAAPAEAQVTLHGERWQAMQPGPPPQPDAPPPLVVSHRTVTLTPDAAADGAPGLRIDARWVVGDGAPAWLDLRLVDASVLVTEVTVDGVPAPLYEAGDGAHIVAWLAPGAVIALQGTRPGDVRRGLRLSLLPAASGIATITSDDLAPTWTGGVVVDHAVWGGAADLGVQLIPPRPATDADQLLVAAEIGSGVTVTDDLVVVRARVRHLVRRGSLDQVVLDVPGAGSDLTVTGPNVGRFDRRGDRLVVTLRQATTTLSALELRWSQALPGGDEASIPLPRVTAVGSTSARSALQLARTGDVEVLPELTGWTATASTELQPWARGLVDGAATASYVGSGRSSGTLSLLRFVPVQGPEVVVDVAEVLMAASRDGRVILRARYEVLNDRAAVLRVGLPDGARLLALRVGDDPAPVTWDDDGTLRVPLRRSIESLGGLLSFPVEIAMLLDGAPWARREQRAIPLPRLDAPVAVLRTTAHLPPGHLPWKTDTLSDRVDDFTRGAGITYGIEVKSAADRDKVAQADALFGEAVRAWESNEFEEAQGLLDQLGGLGAGNENVSRLQGNLDLLLSDEEEGEDAPTAAPSSQAVVQARRVKEQARAKAGKDEAAWEEAQREAERSYRAGDYARAEEEAEKALELGRKLERYEQDESAEVRTRNVKIAEVAEKAKKGRRSRAPAPAPPRAPGLAKKKPATTSASSGEATASDAGGGEIGFDDLSIDADDDGFAFDPEPSPEPVTIAVQSPPVVATTRSVPVPELGSVLRFQKLLLPSGAAPTVTLGARAARPRELP